MFHPDRLFWVDAVWLYSVVLIQESGNIGLNIGFKSYFVVTKFPQIWQPKRIENLSNLEYMPARSSKGVSNSYLTTCLYLYHKEYLQYPVKYIYNSWLLSPKSNPVLDSLTSSSNLLSILHCAILACSAYPLPIEKLAINL